MTENPFWDLIQKYMDDPRHRYRPLAADIARECGLSAQLLSKWKKRPTLPEPEQLMRLSRGTGINYPRLLEAALSGKGYFVAGRARVVTSDYLDPDEEEAFVFEDQAMPFARSLGAVDVDPAAARRAAEILAETAAERAAEEVASDPNSGVNVPSEGIRDAQ